MSNDRSKRRLTLTVLALLLAAMSGCKTLVPYESTFMCEKSSDYGRCTDVQSAYDQALAGGASANQISAPDKAGDASAQATRTVLTSEEHYREIEYRRLAGLIEKPVTPMLRAPTVLRTLIVAYTATDSLYMPRYVFYLAEPARFVIGDYLNPIDVQPTLYPNGGRSASR
jgi:conjugal transfer pilus assembly protein TraV